jgi:hypothetical protein
VADRYLLETGAPDGYLLEDGTGVFLLEFDTTTVERFPYYVRSERRKFYDSFTPPNLAVKLSSGPPPIASSYPEVWLSFRRWHRCLFTRI